MAIEKFISDGVSIDVEMFRPTVSGPHPGIVIAYGTRGLNDPFGTGIRDFGTALADAGFIAAIPHYLDRTGTSASNSAVGDGIILEFFVRRRDQWIETISDCMDYVSGLPEVDSSNIGLLGFSMGGHLGLRLGRQLGTPAIKGIVEFFSPITAPIPFDGLGGSLASLPPLQIHHGGEDGFVYPSQSEDLERELKSLGKIVEYLFYPTEGHGFKSASAISDSTRDTITFFKKYLV